MELEAISWPIKNRLVPDQPEGETSTVWCSILHTLFPMTENYRTGPEMQSGAGRADLFTAHIVFDSQMSEKKFLIVECKAPGQESQAGTWTDEVAQLQRYLGKVSKSSNHRRFGAVAIGKTVRFYELVNGSLVDFDNSDTMYYLDRQCQDVTRILRTIKSAH